MTEVASWICQRCLRVYSALKLECDKCNLEGEKHPWMQACECSNCKVVTNSITDRQRIDEKLKGSNLSTFEYASVFIKCEKFGWGILANEFQNHNCRSIKG